MTTNSQFLRQFLAARRVSTPLIGVETPDPAATIQEIIAALSGKGEAPAILHHDMCRGLVGVNQPGKQAVAALGVDPLATINPVEALGLCEKLPEDALVFCANAQNFLGRGDGSPTQAVWNLRDPFKATGRTLVLMGPALRMPPELEQDVMVLSEPLPDAKALAEIVCANFADAKLPAPKQADVDRAVDALCGLAAFPADQVTAMSVSKTGLDYEALWERKRQVIEQTPGLSVWRGNESFGDIGGCQNVKLFLRRVMDGQDAPRVIVFIDEIEKAVAGSGGDGQGGDTSGVSQEMVGTLLTEMQNTEATGVIFIGPPGAAKSMMAKAAGKIGGIPTIAFDLSGMKSSFVGASGERLRAALKVVQAVGQGRVLYISTCNSIGALSPELRRRFNFGTFFFPLPDAAERAEIWNVYITKYGLSGKHPNDAGWTGAEIKQCALIAYRLKISLVEAASYIVPISVSAAARLEALYRQSDGKFISASKPGYWHMEDQALAAAAPKAGRKISAVDVQ